MKQIKRKIGRSTDPAKEEHLWNENIKRLAKLAANLLYELQIAESLTCLELNEHIDLPGEIARLEVSLIKRVLLQTAGNQSAASRLLGISPACLNAKIKRYQIRGPEFLVLNELGLAE